MAANLFHTGDNHMKRSKRPENYGDTISGIGAGVEDGKQVPAILSSKEYARLSVVGWWHDGVEHNL